MRYSVTLTTILAASLWFAPVHAQDATGTTTSSLGLNEKLKQVYDLYRSGEVVTLKEHEVRVGLGLGYTINESRVLSYQDTARTLATTGTFSYGVTNGTEILLAVPFTYQAHTAGDTQTTLLDTHHAGLGDVAVGLATSLPVPWFSTTGLVSVTFPTASNVLRSDGLGSNGITSTIGFNVDKILQPAFVYGGLNWQRDWGYSKDGIGYTAGIGFFLNYALSVGTELDGIYIINPNKGVPHDRVSLVGKVSYQATPTVGFMPFIGVDLVGNAPGVQLGARLAWRF